ncbi:5149_t:CDS:2, partial [Rhizophagus irregularis]
EKASDLQPRPTLLQTPNMIPRFIVGSEGLIRMTTSPQTSAIWTVQVILQAKAICAVGYL